MNFEHIYKFKFSFLETGLKKEDILQYLGYKPGTIPCPFPGLIDEVYSSISNYCDIKGGYIILEPVEFDRNNYSVTLKNTSLFTKKIIFSQMERSKAIAAFLCTAGPDIEKWSKQLTANSEEMKGYVADTFGSLIVEYATNRIQEALKKQMKEEGLKITNRYSPGYCGWETSDQHRLFTLYPENFCGITLSDSALMHPVKSVSGIIGIGKDVNFNPYRCGVCEEKNCRFGNRNIQAKEKV